MKDLVDGVACPECGGTDFSLARDSTHYSCVSLEEGKLVVSYDHEEFSGDTRMFCVDCGEYVNVPEGLE